MTKENLSIFKKESFAGLVMATADWETTEQWVFWQLGIVAQKFKLIVCSLVHGQGIPIDWCHQLIPKVDAQRHDIIALNMLLIFKRLER